LASREGLSSLIFVALISMASLVSAMIAFSPYLAYHDPNSIELGASLSPSTVAANRTIRIEVYDKNTLSLFANKLPYNPAFGSAEQNLTMGPCSNSPFGFAMFHGYYDLANVTSAKNLWPFDPLAASTCPFAIVVPYGGVYPFEPGQNVSASASFNGFYPGIRGDDAFHAFPPGRYTVLVGDAWNHREVLHFIVTG
jgi:hypothetical protein